MGEGLESPGADPEEKGHSWHGSEETGRRWPGSEWQPVTGGLASPGLKTGMVQAESSGSLG